jgi:hypothetical protein
MGGKPGVESMVGVGKSSAPIVAVAVAGDMAWDVEGDPAVSEVAGGSELLAAIAGFASDRSWLNRISGLLQSP